MLESDTVNDDEVERRDFATGGSGFAHRRLIRRVIGEGHEVSAVSSFQLGFVSRPGRYNTDKARRKLGYRPVTGCSQGLSAL